MWLPLLSRLTLSHTLTYPRHALISPGLSTAWKSDDSFCLILFSKLCHTWFYLIYSPATLLRLCLLYTIRLTIITWLFQRYIMYLTVNTTTSGSTLYQSHPYYHGWVNVIMSTSRKLRRPGRSYIIQLSNIATPGSSLHYSLPRYYNICWRTYRIFPTI